MNTLKPAVLAILFIALAWSVVRLVDLVRPEPPAPEFLCPSPGQVIHSRAEGFTSQVIHTDGERTWLELRLAPHAPGPPPHLHTGFSEYFRVKKGTLSLRVGDRVMILRAGEGFRVPSGVVHQPFNTTDEEVIVGGPLTVDYALPRSFVLFLSQVYGWVDESPQHARPPAVVLQMALFGPRYDIWFAKPPLAVQRIQATLLRPLARLLGYRSYYERFAPSADGAKVDCVRSSQPGWGDAQTEIASKEMSMTQNQDEIEIRELVATFINGWNNGDEKMCARPFADDADFTAVTGQRVQGRVLIGKVHDEILSTVFRGTRNSAVVNDIHFLRPDVAAADVTFRIVPMADKPWLPAYTTAGLIATKESGQWVIAVFRNMVPFARPVAGPVDRELLHRREEALKHFHA